MNSKAHGRASGTDLDEHLDDDLVDAARDLVDRGGAARPRTTTPRAIVERRLAELPALLRERRRLKGLSLRGAAAEIGTSFGTIARAENGKFPDAPNLLSILEWLDVPPAWFVGHASSQIDAYADGWAACYSAVLSAIARTGPDPIPQDEDPDADTAGGGL